jgi:hypothetical protein
MHGCMMRPLTPIHTWVSADLTRAETLSVGWRALETVGGGVEPSAPHIPCRRIVHIVCGGKNVENHVHIVRVAAECRRRAFTRHLWYWNVHYSDTARVITKTFLNCIQFRNWEKMPLGHGQHIFVIWQQTKILDFLGFLVKIPLILL